MLQNYKFKRNMNSYWNIPRTFEKKEIFHIKPEIISPTCKV